MKWKIAVAAMLLGFVVIGVVVWNQRLDVERRSREAHFVSIHFLVSEAVQEGPEFVREDLNQLLDPFGGLDSGLMEPFADGLLFRPAGQRFVLEEPAERRVSWRSWDRLVATERDWPRWEKSGKLARKFVGQEVPPRGYE